MNKENEKTQIEITQQGEEMRRVLPLNAKKIKYYRRCKCMRASELAELVGVTRSSIYAYEKGIQFPIGKLDKIAEVLGVTTEDLVSFGEWLWRTQGEKKYLVKT